jgi:hypothetical protein
MHTVKSLKKFISFFYAENTKIQKYVLACILALITSLLKLWELDQYFNIFKKIFCFLLAYGITNLYIKYIPDIKKVISFI